MALNLKAGTERDILKGFLESITGSGKLPTTKQEQNALFTKYTEELLHNNPYKPPEKGCPINKLPNELLAYIFQIGATPDEEEPDDGYAYLSDSDIGSDDDDDDEDEDVGLSALANGHELPEGVQLKDLPDADADDGNGEWVDDEEDHSSFTSESGSSGSSSTDFEESGHFQVLVSQVCRRWRELALSSPALWTLVDFTEGRPFERSITFLERSQDHPLDILIDCQPTRRPPSDAGSALTIDSEPPEPEPFYSKEDVVTMMNLLVPHVSRWRTLQLMTDDYAHMHTALIALSKCPSAPLLELLQLYHYDDADDAAEFEPKELNESFRILGGDAPKLSTVALWGVHIDWNTPSLFAHLNDMELAYHAKDVRPPWDDFIAILQHSPVLETLTLCQSGPAGESSSWPTEPVELPTVKNLMMRYQEPAYIGDLMKRLVFVNVNTLTLDYDTDDYSAFVRQLAGPMPGGRKSLLSQLEKLKISGMPTEHSAIDRFYGELQICKHLNLDMRHLDAPWFDKLMPVAEGGGQLPLPRLETLATREVSGEQLKELVIARKAAQVPLKKLYVTDRDDIDLETENWLKEQLEVEVFEPSDSEDDDDIDDSLEGGMLVEVD